MTNEIIRYPMARFMAIYAIPATIDRNVRFVQM